MATLNLKSSGGMSPAPQTLSFMDGSTYDQFGNPIKAPNVNVKAGLPTLTKKATSAPVPTPIQTGGTSVADTSQDPMTKFNLGLLDLLKRAQGFDQTKLYNERNRLAVAQANNSMGSADQLGLDGLKPSDALDARKNESTLYKPEINNLTDRLQASSQAISNFKDSLTAAKGFGEEYAKFVKPTDDVISAAQAMLEAGHDPSTEVMNKVGQYIDWGKVAVADKARKASGGSVTERTMSKQQDVIARAQTALAAEAANSVDHKANPNTYRKFKTEYIGANGTPSDFFQALPVEQYISEPNQKGDLLQSTSVVKDQTTTNNQARLKELMAKANNGTEISKLSLPELMELQQLRKSQ